VESLKCVFGVMCQLEQASWTLMAAGLWVELEGGGTTLKCTFFPAAKVRKAFL